MSTVTKAFDKNIEQCLRHGQPADGGLPWLIGYKADGSKCRVIFFLFFKYPVEITSKNGQLGLAREFL